MKLFGSIRLTAAILSIIAINLIACQQKNNEENLSSTGVVETFNNSPSVDMWGVTGLAKSNEFLNGPTRISIVEPRYSSNGDFAGCKDLFQGVQHCSRKGSFVGNEIISMRIRTNPNSRALGSSLAILTEDAASPHRHFIWSISETPGNFNVDDYYCMGRRRDQNTGQYVLNSSALDSPRLTLDPANRLALGACVLEPYKAYYLNVQMVSYNDISYVKDRNGTLLSNENGLVTRSERFDVSECGLPETGGLRRCDVYYQWSAHFDDYGPDVVRTDRLSQSIEIVRGQSQELTLTMEGGIDGHAVIHASLEGQGLEVENLDMTVGNQPGKQKTDLRWNNANNPRTQRLRITAQPNATVDLNSIRSRKLKLKASGLYLRKEGGDREAQRVFDMESEFEISIGIR